MIDFTSFLLGCNYWASHAGTAMWSDWRPDIVEEDFKLLQQTGMNTLRVFPLWPDFQPIRILYSAMGTPREYRFSEDPLPAGEWGQAGVSATAMERFLVFSDLATKYGLRLIPGLITGWMSGRLFVPPALEGKNILSDPVALMWQVRFVRCFVRAFKSHPAIIAWDLGNECNCLAPASSREIAWNWTAAVANAIRVEDDTRPVISGMHGLGASRTSVWNIEDQGELTDILTVHPYPIFTPHCDRDPINTLRSCLHATAEAVFYADIADRPCLVEEVGTLGPNTASNSVAADYLRTVLFSLWSHGNVGLLWWCGFDQGRLGHAPYDWHAFERELGVFTDDLKPKPIADEISKFSVLLQKAPILPSRSVEGVCILTEGQDCWGTAYASFILAKQAGFELEFQTSSQPLRSSNLYLLPSLSEQPSRRFYSELMLRIFEGATLYVSLKEALLYGFASWIGLEPQTRQQRPTSTAQIKMGGNVFTIQSPYRLNLAPVGAEILARESDGNPAFTHFSYGKGKVYFLSVPLETHVSLLPSAFHGDAAPFWQFYTEFSSEVRQDRALGKDNPCLGITEHPRDASSRYATLINYSPDPLHFPLNLRAGWKVDRCLHGACDEKNVLSLPGNDAAVLSLLR